MKIIINDIEPQFKVYKITESINNKIYIGSTFQPLKHRMSLHKCCHNDLSKYFSDIGWNNTTVEIIDTANDKTEMKRKEDECIKECRINNSKLLLNQRRAYVGSRREYANNYYKTKYNQDNEYRKNILSKRRKYYLNKKDLKTRSIYILN